MKNTRMSKLARRRLKNPAAVRLAALKAYRALSKPARKLAKAVIVDGQEPSEATGGPNWARIWNSRPVIDCLTAYGWQPPAKPLPALPEGPAKPYQPAEALPEVPERPCEVCGEIGRHTSRHNQHLVCHACLCQAGNIFVSRISAEPVPEPARPVPAAYEEPRCPQCSLVLCNCPRPVVVGGEPRPVHLMHHQVMPRLQDLDFWQREVDADKARRAVANANIDENCQESRILRELARRELTGEY